MSNPKRIELLSPARDKDTAIAAISHGADAVYIGAEDFSARSAAGNTVDDIAAVVDYAHTYGARVYVTTNTILHDGELSRAERLIHRLYECGVDALIVQDMALLEMSLPPIELHASTQTDIRSADKARFLYDAGFSRLVLARELSLSQIQEIHHAVPEAEIECFVHGALCVSYSGQCYMSECFNARSANRGRCAQLCRLPYTVKDANGVVLSRDSHVLSLRDMNRSAHLGQMIDAGVSSFKIEGRLKDVSYVKNITAYYRGALDEIIAQRTDVCPLSAGKVELNFSPDPRKSFNRGTTTYFLSGKRDEDVSFPLSPKSLGEYVGRVTAIKKDCIITDGAVQFNNGDGFCFVTQDGHFGGFRIDLSDGKRLFPTAKPVEGLTVGAALYRNMDIDFNRRLSGNTASRYIDLDFSLSLTDSGFSLQGISSDGFQHISTVEFEHQKASKPQQDNIVRVLSKTGDTPYKVRDISLGGVSEYFLPSSILTAMRRECTDSITLARKETMLSCRIVKEHSYPSSKALVTDYRANVYNDVARDFYAKCGVRDVSPAYEQQKAKGARLALCKHCLRYAMGLCPKNGGGGSKAYSSLYLESGKIRMRADFDCSACEMSLYED